MSNTIGKIVEEIKSKNDFDVNNVTDESAELQDFKDILASSAKELGGKKDEILKGIVSDYLDENQTGKLILQKALKSEFKGFINKFKSGYKYQYGDIYGIELFFYLYGGNATDKTKVSGNKSNRKPMNIMIDNDGIGPQTKAFFQIIADNKNTNFTVNGATFSKGKVSENDDIYTQNKSAYNSIDLDNFGGNEVGTETYTYKAEQNVKITATDTQVKIGSLNKAPATKITKDTGNGTITIEANSIDVIFTPKTTPITADISVSEQKNITIGTAKITIPATIIKFESKLTPKTDSEKLTEANKNLDLGDLKNVTADLKLPVTQGGTTVSWKSETPTVISNDGKVTRPTNGKGNATVKLTATLTLGNEIPQTKTFTVTVKELDKVEETFSLDTYKTKLNAITDPSTIPECISKMFEVYKIQTGLTAELKGKKDYSNQKEINDFNTEIDKRLKEINDIKTKLVADENEKKKIKKYDVITPNVKITLLKNLTLPKIEHGISEDKSVEKFRIENTEYDISSTDKFTKIQGTITYTLNLEKGGTVSLEQARDNKFQVIADPAGNIEALELQGNSISYTFTTENKNKATNGNLATDRVNIVKFPNNDKEYIFTWNDLNKNFDVEEKKGVSDFESFMKKYEKIASENKTEKDGYKALILDNKVYVCSNTKLIGSTSKPEVGHGNKKIKDSDSNKMISTKLEKNLDKDIYELKIESVEKYN